MTARNSIQKHAIKMLEMQAERRFPLLLQTETLFAWV